MGLAVCFASLLCLSGSLAFGDTLHGFCISPTPACNDNGTITITKTNPPSFGFVADPGKNKYDFELLFLAPDNEDVTPGTFSLTLNGTNVTNTSVTSALFKPVAFTSGKLEDYLGLSYTPSNPLSAFQPSTRAVDLGASGYYIYTFDFGNETGNSKKQSTAPQFSLSSGSIPLGSVFLGLEWSGRDVVGATPPSGAIIVDASSVPEPASSAFALVGLALIAIGSARKRIFRRDR